MAAKTQKRCAWSKSKKRKNMRKIGDEEQKSLAAGDQDSWFRQEDSLLESFAEPKNPVSASGKKIF